MSTTDDRDDVTTYRDVLFGSGAPKLLYVCSDGSTIATVDRFPLQGDRRERELCRALLRTALILLDEAEKED